MIDIKFFIRNDDVVEFKICGHAEYDEYGRDIVCASVSVLVINTINSIEQFTDDKFITRIDEKDGLIEFKLSEQASSSTNLLLNSLKLGLSEITNEYNEYICFREYKIK